MPAQKRLTPEMVGEHIEAPLTPLKVRISDLTGRQVRAIELAVGVPLSRLEERSSDVTLAAAIRSVVEKVPLDTYLDRYPAMALVSSVELLDDEDDEDDDPGNG